jgi:diacylglycerol kinase family enzyme
VKLLIFHNRSAGSGDVEATDLVRAAEAAGFETVYLEKERGLPPPDALDGALVVVAGGDGTVAKAFRTLAGTGIRCTILPLGGANNVAKALGFPASAHEVMRGLRKGRVHRFRLGEATAGLETRRFVEAVGCGAIAAGLADKAGAGPGAAGAEKIRAGREALRDRLAAVGPIRSRISIDGMDLPSDLLFAEVLNVSPTGPGLNLSAEMTPGGDVLHLAFLRAEGRDAFRAALDRDEALPVEVLRGRVVEVDRADDPLRIDDALCAAPETPRRLRVTRADLVVEVIVPAMAIGEGET